MALAMAAASAAPAFAGDFYVGGDIGRSKVNGGSETIGSTTVTMTYWKDTTCSIFGGYTISENIALEVGYRSQGKTTMSVDSKTVDMKGSALQFSMVASMPVATDFSIYGRLGFNRVKATASYAGNSASDSESKALVGFGARYAISKEAGVRAELQKLASDVSALTVGVDFKF